MSAMLRGMLVVLVFGGVAAAQQESGRIRVLPSIKRPLAPSEVEIEEPRDPLGEFPELTDAAEDPTVVTAEARVRDTDREMQAEEAEEILDAHTPNSFERWAIVAIVAGGALLAFLLWVGRMIRGAHGA